jgi:hypothetical protein
MTPRPSEMIDFHAHWALHFTPSNGHRMRKFIEDCNTDPRRLTFGNTTADAVTLALVHISKKVGDTG